MGFLNYFFHFTKLWNEGLILRQKTKSFKIFKPLQILIKDIAPLKEGFKVPDKDNIIIIEISSYMMGQKADVYLGLDLEKLYYLCNVSKNDYHDVQIAILKPYWTKEISVTSNLWGLWKYFHLLEQTKRSLKLFLIVLRIHWIPVDSWWKQNRRYKRLLITYIYNKIILTNVCTAIIDNVVRKLKSWKTGHFKSPANYKCTFK